jgi:hypothetical protein
MRQPCADREEKRVTHRSDTIPIARDQEQLDLNNPNQRGLLDLEARPVRHDSAASDGRAGEQS